MEITLKLFATLGDHLPPGARFNQVVQAVPDGATVADVIGTLNLPSALVHLVLVNGVFVPPDQRPTRCLQAGDALAIWPPIAGG